VPTARRALRGGRAPDPPQHEREQAAYLLAAPEAMPEAIWISPWETMALNCYAMRYPHLLSGYCGGKAEIKRTDDMKDAIATCNYQGLLAHWRDHGSKEGLNRECADASVKCYAMANPDLVTAYCPGGYQFCDWTKLDLLKHYALFGHKEGRYLACDSPSARCYVQRSPELRASLCSGDIEQCNWMSVHEHYIENPATDPRLGMFCAEGEGPPRAENKHEGGHGPNANANDKAAHDGHSPGGPGDRSAKESDAAKERAFVLRLSMTAHSCKLDAFLNEPQCKARADPGPAALALAPSLLAAPTRAPALALALTPNPNPNPNPHQARAAAAAIKQEKDPARKQVLVRVHTAGS